MREPPEGQLLLDFHSFTWQVVWQHKPRGYSLTGTIPCTLSDNISHCVQSTTPLFTPMEQSYPAFLFQIPPFSPWEEISFPFHSCELSHDVMLTEFPLLQTIQLTSALLLATANSCVQKRKEKRKKAADPSHLSYWRMETTLSDNGDLSPAAVLSASSWLGQRERGGGICSLCRRVRWCVGDKAALCQGWAFVFDMNFIILFWPLRLAMVHFSFPLLVWQKKALLRLENTISTEMKRWKIHWGVKTI